MKIYRVKVYEKTHCGLVDCGGHICELIVKAATPAQAERKTLVYCQAEEYGPCRVASIQETDFDNSL